MSIISKNAKHPIEKKRIRTEEKFQITKTTLKMKKPNPFYAMLALVSLSASLLSSCCKTVDCTAGNAEIATVNPSTADIDTFYLRRYKLNTNFAQKIDTFIFRLNENFRVFGIDMDTLSIQSFYNPSIPKQFFVEAGFDYELESLHEIDIALSENSVGPRITSCD